jgi:sugar-specific transcriptional regulator TrmB
MYSLIKLLQQIGLTEKESKAYLITLKIGTNPVSTIAKHVQYNRTNMYSILENLVKKGLIIQFEKNNIRYFTAVEPRYLLNYIEDKKRILSHYKYALDQKIPEFEALKNPYQLIPNVKSFIGKEGIKKILEEAINQSKLWVIASPSKQTHTFFIEQIPLYLNKYPMINLIIADDKTYNKYHITSSTEIQSLPAIKPIQCIGQNKVFIISTNENYGVEIENSDIVNHFEKQFEHAWSSKK